MKEFDIHEASPFKFFVVLNKMNKVLQAKLDQHFSEFGLTGTEFMVLDALYTHKTLPTQQIGAIVLITSGAITHVLNCLEKKGLIIRTQSDEDKRIFYARLTDAGIKFWQNYLPEHQRFITAIMAGFDQDKLSQLTNLLKEFGLYLANQN